MVNTPPSDPDRPPVDPLARVCALLNAEQARYVVVGAQACILHGLVRTTEDVDLLVAEDDDNLARVIRALANMEDHAAAELTVADLRDNVVVKVADEVEVDISRRAWSVDFDEAAGSAVTTEIDGIRIPYASLPVLIRSKETYRERDQADLVHLRRLLARQQPGGG